MAAEQPVAVSAGQLHSAAQLLDVIAEMKLGTVALVSEMRTVLVCPVDDVLNLSIRCGWVVTDGDGNLTLSARGKDVRGSKDYRLRLQEQLKDCVSALRPTWSRLIPDGQREFARFAPQDIVQCFDEAGVLERPITPGVLAWWDGLADLARGFRVQRSTLVGRNAERLSLEYETHRIGSAPIWESVDSNLSGYDVLSKVSRRDLSLLQIEVKGSENPLQAAWLYLTAWEWSVAQGLAAHTFHLWLLAEKPRLAIVPVDLMAEHVPSNLGLGEWEKVAIPFRSFAGLFPPEN